MQDMQVLQYFFNTNISINTYNQTVLCIVRIPTLQQCTTHLFSDYTKILEAPYKSDQAKAEPAGPVLPALLC